MGDIDEQTKNKFSYLKEGEIILLENIRFFSGEITNDDSFCQKVGFTRRYLYQRCFFIFTQRTSFQYIKSQNI